MTFQYFKDGQWVDITGDTGVQISDTEPTNKAVIWADTTEPGEAAFITADAPLTYDSGTQTVGSDGSLAVTVEHGSDDSEPRPAFAGLVYWKGDVAPQNGVNGDLWYDTTGDA